ncbi:MAG TPA: lipid II flippase MurJ [Acidimicrobiia bacterium]|nr:lipid II flippase MurJ [Acidimicrobiia bacterium]
MAAVERPTRAATRMSVATLTSRGIGFVRVWAIAAILGTTFLGNTYQSSSSVSNVLFELLAAGALSAVLVPTFVGLLDAGEEERAERLAAGMLGVGLAAMGVVTVVGMVFAPQIARLLSSGAPTQKILDQQIELSTFFLYFFIPQVMLYVLGTVATGILYAKKRYVITAVAPIANTVFVVASLVLFWLVAGSEPGLDLTLTEKLILGIGGLLGVMGFVGVPVVALVRGGFRFVPSLRARDPQLRKMLSLSAWAVFQHAGVGLLLLASIVMGNQVAGGVVAYQFAFVAFLAPYAILAQPVQTTTLTEVSLDAARGDHAAFADRVRWALDSTATLILPVSAAYLVLAKPAMEVIHVGDNRVDLYAAALASLGVGLFVYCAFLLLARCSYALGDSRTPALVAFGSAIIGSAVMVVGGLTVSDGPAKVVVLGLGHSIAYLIGTVVLWVVLRRRLDQPLFPHAIWRALGLSTVLGAAAWLVMRLLSPHGRVPTLATLLLIGLVGGGAYLGMLRLLPKRTGGRPGVSLEPDDPDLVADLDL